MFCPGASSVCKQCDTVVEQAGRLFVSFLGVLRVVIWTTRQKEFHEGETFSSQTLVPSHKHQIEDKIRSERKRLSSLGFGERWATVAHMCHVVGASLLFTLDIPGT